MCHGRGAPPAPVKEAPLLRGRLPECSGASGRGTASGAACRCGARYASSARRDDPPEARLAPGNGGGRPPDRGAAGHHRARSRGRRGTTAGGAFSKADARTAESCRNRWKRHVRGASLSVVAPVAPWGSCSAAPGPAGEAAPNRLLRPFPSATLFPPPLRSFFPYTRG